MITSLLAVNARESREPGRAVSPEREVAVSIKRCSTGSMTERVKGAVSRVESGRSRVLRVR